MRSPALDRPCPHEGGCTCKDPGPYDVEYEDTYAVPIGDPTLHHLRAFKLEEEMNQIQTTVIPPQPIPGRFEDPTPVPAKQVEVEELSALIWEGREVEEVPIDACYHLASVDGDPFYTVSNMEEQQGYPLAEGCPILL